MLDKVLLEEINLRLKLYYGLYIDQPLFRVSWAPEQFEKRKVEFLSGIQLLVPEFMTMPKYPWMGAQYVVEKLTVNSSSEIEGNLIYQPLYDFPEGLPLNEQACQMVINACLERIPGAFKEAVAKKQEEKDKAERKFARDLLENIPSDDEVARVYSK